MDTEEPERVNEETTLLVALNPEALESTDSQFWPENEADPAMLVSCFCSCVISVCTLALSTPGSRAATSLLLIELTTSIALFIAVYATSTMLPPRPRASWTVDSEALSDFMV